MPVSLLLSYIEYTTVYIYIYTYTHNLYDTNLSYVTCHISHVICVCIIYHINIHSIISHIYNRSYLIYQYLSIYLSINLSFNPSIHPSICQSIMSKHLPFLWQPAGCWVNCGLPEPVWLRGSPASFLLVNSYQIHCLSQDSRPFHHVLRGTVPGKLDSKCRFQKLLPFREAVTPLWPSLLLPGKDIASDVRVTVRLEV